MKVHECRVAGATKAAPGTVIASDDVLTVACGEGTSLSLLTVQPEGSKPMPVKDLLRGHTIAVGTVITGNTDG